MRASGCSSAQFAPGGLNLTMPDLACLLAHVDANMLHGWPPLLRHRPRSFDAAPCATTASGWPAASSHIRFGKRDVRRQRYLPGRGWPTSRRHVAPRNRKSRERRTAASWSASRRRYHAAVPPFPQPRRQQRRCVAGPTLTFSLSSALRCFAAANIAGVLFPNGGTS